MRVIAGADDERHQRRWRYANNLDRPQSPAGRLGRSGKRRCAAGRGLPQPPKIVDARACRRRSATRVVSRPTCRVRDRDRAGAAGHRGDRPATSPAATIAPHRPRCAVRVLQGTTALTGVEGRTVVRTSDQTVDAGGLVSVSGSASRTACRRATGTNSHRPARQKRSARRRRPVRHQHEDPARRGSRRASPLDPDQDQPDRHAVQETFAAVEMAEPRRYTTSSRTALGETEDSPIADIAVGLERRPDQDRLAVAFPTASPSTTSCTPVRWPDVAWWRLDRSCPAVPALAGRRRWLVARLGSLIAGWAPAGGQSKAGNAQCRSMPIRATPRPA